MGRMWNMKMSEIYVPKAGDICCCSVGGTDVRLTNINISQAHPPQQENV